MLIPLTDFTFKLLALTAIRRYLRPNNDDYINSNSNNKENVQELQSVGVFKSMFTFKSYLIFLSFSPTKSGLVR